jgi:CO dehydrogenase nickel-insertion accessory protein CooC1
VDCDPNPNLAESFGLESSALPRFDHSALSRSGATLELAREPELAQPAANLWVLGGPPGPDALVDAVARGIAGVLVADRFDRVVTDLGAGPEFARLAVGGVLNPADVCLVLTDGAATSELAAERIEDACRDRKVESIRALNRRGEAEAVATELTALLDAR